MFPDKPRTLSRATGAKPPAYFVLHLEKIKQRQGTQEFQRIPGRRIYL